MEEINQYTDIFLFIGEFIFAVSSDDNSEFWLSVNENPENLQLLAYVGEVIFGVNDSSGWVIQVGEIYNGTEYKIMRCITLVGEDSVYTHPGVIPNPWNMRLGWIFTQLFSIK